MASVLTSTNSLIKLNTYILLLNLFASNITYFSFANVEREIVHATGRVNLCQLFYNVFRQCIFRGTYGSDVSEKERCARPGDAKIHIV